MIEQHAAELAADFLRDNTSGLQGEMAAAHLAALAGDNEKFSHHNAAFHRQIVAASGNSILLRVWDALGAEIRTQVLSGSYNVPARAVAEKMLSKIVIGGSGQLQASTAA